MHTRIICIPLLVFLFTLGSASAQPFFGYQTTGVHQVFVSLSYDGQESEVGVGYGFRRPWGGFTDFTAEWKAPLADIWGEKQSLIVGAYGPVRLRNRRFMGGGIHTRFKWEGENTQVQLAGTILPSYAFAAPLGDQPYVTGGIRATGLVNLAEKTAGSGGTRWFTGFGTELGGRLDMHVERTLGLATNVYASREWGGDKQEKWQAKGDVYAGSAYFLFRW